MSERARPLPVKSPSTVVSEAGCMASAWWDACQRANSSGWQPPHASEPTNVAGLAGGGATWGAVCSPERLHAMPAASAVATRTHPRIARTLPQAPEAPECASWSDNTLGQSAVHAAHGEPARQELQG